MIMLQAESKRGSGTKMLGEKGYARIDFTSNVFDYKCIITDDFQGCGNEYKQRENTKIIICNFAERFEFESFEKLIEQLKK